MNASRHIPPLAAPTAPSTWPLNNVADWLDNIGGDPDGLDNPVNGYVDQVVGIWHAKPTCANRHGRVTAGQWHPRQTSARLLCHCTGRTSLNMRDVTVDTRTGRALDIWWNDQRTHGDISARVGALTDRELVTYAHTVSVAGHLHPALRDRVAAELAERETDIQLLLLAHGATPCQTTGDRIYDDTRPDGHTTVNWNSWLDTTGELATQILRADQHEHPALIAAFIDRVCDIDNVAQHTTAAELASWSATWAAPWTTDANGYTTVSSWLIAETAARLRTLLEPALTAWADNLHTNWMPILNRRYLIQGVSRRTGDDIADLEQLCHQRRLNSERTDDDDDVYIVDGATAVFSQKPLNSYTADDGGTEPRLVGKWADVTDDTDTVLHTALGLIDDGVPLIDALATARALHT
jgi:hypothetical protein